MMKWPISALAIAACIGSAGAETVTASCTTNGVTVYREMFPAKEVQARRSRVMSLNPGALCVFLDAGSRQDTGNVLAAMTEHDPGSGGLAAALAAIMGGEVGQKYPPEAIDAMESVLLKRGATAVAADDRSINLVLGVYKSVPFRDVIEHWKGMKQKSEALSRFTPTVSSIDDVTVLSVEKVPDEMVAETCAGAEAAGAGCMAAY